jgi:hypothetical protein
VLAISIPRTESAVVRYFQERMPHGARERFHMGLLNFASETVLGRRLRRLGNRAVAFRRYRPPPFALRAPGSHAA